jgi:hypothetical protein
MNTITNRESIKEEVIRRLKIYTIPRDWSWSIEGIAEMMLLAVENKPIEYPDETITAGKVYKDKYFGDLDKAPQEVQEFVKEEDLSKRQEEGDYHKYNGPID